MITQYSIYKFTKENERKTQNRPSCSVVDIKPSNFDKEFSVLPQDKQLSKFNIVYTMHECIFHPF